MTNVFKIRKLIEAWLDGIYLEELSHAEVEVGKKEKQKIWDKGIQLVGDQLLIEQTLFKTFKKTYQQFEEKENQQDFQVAVAFPQIYRVEKGERKFRPLFTIDISSFFGGKYCTKGWNVTQFEFQPVIPNLIDLGWLDEENIDNLVIREGLKVFLETTFKYSFATLQDFLDRMPLPASSLVAKSSPYLLRFDFVPYNYNLKKDLRKILSQDFWDWATPRYPAYEYLLGQPRSPRHEVLYLGAFPTSPANDSQSSALKHFQENPLTAVIGPAGNGKTTLLLSIPAQQVVKRAYHLALTGIDRSNLTLVTSTNNRAVTNVIEQFAATLGTQGFYLEGGRLDSIQKLAIPKLQAAIDWLSSEQFNEAEWKRTAQQIVDIANQLQNLPQQDQERFHQRKQDLQALKRLNREIEAISHKITNLRQQQQTPATSPYADYPLEAYQQILPHLENAVKSLPPVEIDQLLKKTNNWWQRFWYSLRKLWQFFTKTRTRDLIFRLKQHIDVPLTATLATPFPFQLPCTRESLETAHAQVANQLREVYLWRTEQQTSVLDPVRNLERQFRELKGQKALLEQRIASYPTEDFYTRFPREYHSSQTLLFNLSWQYLQQEALRRSEEAIASIKTYIDVISSFEYNYDARRRFAKNWPSILRDVSLLFPVFASTLQSVRNIFPYPDSGCIDVALFDEAGMIPLHQAFPVLVRANKAVVVGDPMQLEPIVSFSQSVIEQYYERAFKERGLTDADYERYSPTSIYTATAYHRAAGASGQLGDLGNGILLDEHYRCVPPIIQLGIALCGYALTIQTSEKPSKLGSNLIAYQVEGTIQDETNPEEVELIDRLIAYLLAQGYTLAEIGVISPYRAQADALRETLAKHGAEFERNGVGTVHTFQGGQKPVIIFSTRQCRESDTVQFINRRPNLLYTAVSRARELFIRLLAKVNDKIGKKVIE